VKTFVWVCLYGCVGACVCVCLHVVVNSEPVTFLQCLDFEEKKSDTRLMHESMYW